MNKFISHSQGESSPGKSNFELMFSRQYRSSSLILQVGGGHIYDCIFSCGSGAKTEGYGEQSPLTLREFFLIWYSRSNSPFKSSRQQVKRIPISKKQK